MTQGIENMLNLPSMEDILNGQEPKEVEVASEAEEFDEVANEAALKSAVALAEQADKQLAIQDGDGHAPAMDEIHKETLKHARDLVDLGFNVDQRSAATIFEKATMMYKVAQDAKDSRRKMQIEMMKIMQNQRKLDLEEAKMRHEMGDRPIEAEALVVEDRNELIKRMREQTIQKAAEAAAAERSKADS